MLSAEAMTTGDAQAADAQTAVAVFGCLRAVLSRRLFLGVSVGQSAFVALESSQKCSRHWVTTGEARTVVGTTERRRELVAEQVAAGRLCATN